ncbi:mitochondrial alternative oxidase [Pluteus cervinus]|uniref:Mitochondrial alternative oxidase n=1 Tax=Pluteus cervinus TaxID=181527 RepID=A0ACD3B674_9AGAR|nr:mitochondrial alternative oxidase [Pluteus cervinus]
MGPLRPTVAACFAHRVYHAPHYTRALTNSALARNALSDRKAEAASVSAHKQDRPATASDAVEELRKENAVSTVPNIFRGDWVLFHPVYTPEELKSVQVLHREAKTISDKLAYRMVWLARRIFDLVSGYKHPETPPSPNMTIEELRKAGYLLDDRAWLNRSLFLESIAGVPGMVAATLRHLQSLRLLRRDNGWIHTCLEEAENERMHLMTFMTLKRPSIFLRAMILGAQGVFYNLFFLAYLVSPRTCHRFVGHLEEEAVLTYTRCIADLEAGKIPEWENTPAPGIAIDYWRLHPEAKLLDVLYAIRSDETTHRFVNHSLANLNPNGDVNPFALREPDMHVKGTKIEFERAESEAYVKESHEILREKSDVPR